MQQTAVLEVGYY